MLGKFVNGRADLGHIKSKVVSLYLISEISEFEHQDVSQEHLLFR